MKTTVELPDELLIATKKYAAESRTTLRDLIARGLRLVLNREPMARPDKGRRKKVRWVTVPGGLPEGVDMADRESMYRWFGRTR